jgi:hypothetical protein
MKRLFNLHAGEIVAGEHIEREYKHLNVWVPTKDTGVDLLLTNANKKVIAVQVKYSKDFRASLKNPQLRERLYSCGWWALSRKKIEESRADYWIFVLERLRKNSHDFILIQPADLLKRLEAPRGRKKTYHVHFWVTDNSLCWETNGLSLKTDKPDIAEGSFKDKQRDFTKYLNNWNPIEKLNADARQSVPSGLEK